MAGVEVFFARCRSTRFLPTKLLWSCRQETPNRRPSACNEASTIRRAVRHAALLLALVILPGCGSLTLSKQEDPTPGTEPNYGPLVANTLKSFLKEGSYDAVEISPVRWVHTLNGWNWLACVRYREQGHRRTYAVLIRENAVVESHFAVQTDACNAQTYVPFDVKTGTFRPGDSGNSGPLY